MLSCRSTHIDTFTYFHSYVAHQYLLVYFKAHCVVFALCLLMPTSMGRARTRDACLRVSCSQYFYTVFWAGRPLFSSLGTFLQKVRRRVAIRCALAYHTVSYNTVTVIAHIPPINLLVLKYCEAVDAKRRDPVVLNTQEPANTRLESKALTQLRFD